jgi:hypothetical protein
MRRIPASVISRNRSYSLEGLAERIHSQEGEASLLETTSPSEAWERTLVERFNTARREEYAEVVENIERFEDEVRRESRKRKFTFAELEDIESDWDKIQRWRERIVARDFFDASARAEAEAALERGKDLLNEFAAAVYRNEGVQNNGDDPDVRGD